MPDLGIRLKGLKGLKGLLGVWLAIPLLLVAGDRTQAASVEAATPKQVAEAMRRASPGDVIVMKSGVWKDARIVFEANGAEGKPITLRAENPGDVILTGDSSLSFAGSYITVDGLYFKQGTTTNPAIIEFRTGPGHTASNSRLTNTAFVDYNPASKETEYKWISVYGQHNRIDHNYLKGKNHVGSTLTVWREDDSAQYHQIDHNYFSDFAVLGLNGGESIRIGTSDTSMSDSDSVVEYNLFEHTDGEGEIVSVKSGGNTVRYNTFRESRGSLTLRHGNGNLVDGNVFLGGRINNTWGIRVTGENHKVVNNYVEGVRGGTSSALALIDGLVDSPLYGYYAIRNALIAGNTFVDNERTIVIGDLYNPKEHQTMKVTDVELRDNLISGYGGRLPLVTVTDEPVNMKGSGNVAYGGTLGLPAGYDGIAVADPLLRLSADGLYRPEVKGPASGKGIGSIPKPLAASDVGPDWVKERIAGGDPLLQTRNLLELEKSRQVELPWNPNDASIILNVGSNDAYVGNTRTKLDMIDPRIVPLAYVDTAYIPLRFTAEKLGARVEWDAATRSVKLVWPKRTATLAIGSGSYQADGKSIADSSPPIIVHDKAYLPYETMGRLADMRTYMDANDVIVFSPAEEALNRLTQSGTMALLADLFRVTSSTDDGNVAANTIDGNADTRWSADGDGHWIRYDLGERKTLGSAALQFLSGDKRITYFDLEVSDDNRIWTPVFKGQSSGKSDAPETFDVTDAAGRYVRIIGHMNSLSGWISLAEVKLFGPDGQELKVDYRGTGSKTVGGAANPEPAVKPVDPPKSTLPPDGVPLYAVDGSADTYLEAEAYTAVAGAFQELICENCSNGMAMHTPDGTSPSLSNGSEHQLTYHFQVAGGGTFYVFILTTGPDAQSDSFNVAVDMGADQAMITGKPGIWEWKRTKAIELSEGPHALQIKMREDGAQIDKILITSNTKAPEGLGGEAQAKPAP